MGPVRRFLLVTTAVAAVGGLAGCGGDPRPAATVDGTPVTQQDVVDELEAIQANTDYVAGIEGVGARVVGSEGGSFDAAFVATQLGLRIQYTIVSNEVARRGLAADDECRSAARDSLVSQLARLSATGDGEPLFDAFPTDYQDYLVQRETDVLLLQGDLIGQPCVSDSAVEAYYAAHEDEFVQACSAHILLATEAEATEVLAQLAAGADFATLARERSLDAGSAEAGGELPCVSPGELVPEFDAALFEEPVGLVAEPVETSFGFHVIDIGSREAASLDEAADQVRQAIAGEVQTSFGSWFGAALAEASVEVDPRYGEWDATTAEVVRPTGGAPATTATTTDPLAGG